MGSEAGSTLPRMSELPDNQALPVPADAGEIVDAQPAGSGLSVQRRAASLPAVQAAAAAAGGFVAGAAVAGLMHRRHTRAPAGARRSRTLGRRRSGGRGAAPELLQIVGSRSLLLDVHLLGGSGAGR